MLKKSKPRISIITPVLNVGKYLTETIKSVQNQSFPQWELIILDGASKDDTADIAHRYADHDPRIRVYSEPDECVWQAVDKGLDLARGEFLAIVCGQDGLLDRDWLAKCIEIFDRDKEVSLVWGLGRGMTEEGKFFSEGTNVYYEHLIANEPKTVFVKRLAVKTFYTVWDLAFGTAERRKFLLQKVFSSQARLKINNLAKRSFGTNGPPQKKDWFFYWLETGLPFLDQSLVVSKDVFLACIPRYQKGQRTLGYMNDFFYRFNANGYLAHFLPTYATFSRMHRGNSSERGSQELHLKMQEYLNQVMELRERVNRGEEVIFRDRSSKPLVKNS